MKLPNPSILVQMILILISIFEGSVQYVALVLRPESWS